MEMAVKSTNHDFVAAWDSPGNSAWWWESFNGNNSRKKRVAALPNREKIMQLTTEESERAAYAANDTPLAIVWGRVIDLENQACELRALVREAIENTAHMRRAAARKAYGVKLTDADADARIASADADAESWHWRAEKALEDDA